MAPGGIPRFEGICSQLENGPGVPGGLATVHRDAIPHDRMFKPLDFHRIVLKLHRVTVFEQGANEVFRRRVVRRLDDELAPLGASRISPSSITTSPPLMT